MERVVVYTETLDIESITPALSGYEIVRAASEAEAARAIVERSRVSTLVLQKAQVDESFGQLLDSIAKSFPLLRVCLIMKSTAQKPPVELIPQGCRLIAAGDPMLEELRSFLSGSGAADRRERLRFDWPLRGSLSMDGKSWQTYNLWALSAEGAFLESPAAAPARGSRGILRIKFQNSRLSSLCHVLERRPPSSRLPAGFAVRLVKMSAESMEVMDRIIRDALVRSLLEPEEESQIPSLEEQDLAIPEFESL
jgi:hypothetical protein